MEIWHFSRETSRSVYKSTRERVDSRTVWRLRLHLMGSCVYHVIKGFSRFLYSRGAHGWWITEKKKKRRCKRVGVLSFFRIPHVNFESPLALDCIAPYKVIWIPESRDFSFQGWIPPESRLRRLESGTQNPLSRNMDSRTMNPESTAWNQESKTVMNPVHSRDWACLKSI